MAVYRVQRTRDYTVMSNYHLKDKGLTLKSTAKNECITMVENIMAYWKEQAAKYNNQ